MVKLGLVVLLALSAFGCGGSSSARSTAGPEAGPGPASVPASQAQAQLTPQEREILDLIERYLASPSEAPPDAPQRIMVFAATSSKIMVVLDEKVAPWVTEEIDDALKQHMLAAYMGGSTASQLRSGKKDDDLRAGVEATVRVYAALRKQGARSAQMEKLVELDGKGELRAHIDRLIAERAAAMRGG
ncbi:MAG TPA: hypothetical protein VNO30_04290 [Kofleriaceae bacterium]|nr:hypothetical protein [Kofleriaceae bacterium]